MCCSLAVFHEWSACGLGFLVEVPSRSRLQCQFFTGAAILSLRSGFLNSALTVRVFYVSGGFRGSAMNHCPFLAILVLLLRQSRISYWLTGLLLMGIHLVV